MMSESNSSKSKGVVVIGCFDIKGADFGYLYSCLKEKRFEVSGATVHLDSASECTQIIVDAVKKTNNDTFFLVEGGPINTSADVRYALDHVTGLHGFVGASSIGKIGI